MRVVVTVSLKSGQAVLNTSQDVLSGEGKKKFGGGRGAVDVF